MHHDDDDDNEMRNTHKILVGKRERRDDFGDLGIDGRVLIWRLTKQVVRCGPDPWDSVRIGTSEHGNEPSGSMKRRVHLEEMSDYELIKKESSQCSSLILMTLVACYGNVYRVELGSSDL